jgi:hypothetical protein
MIEEHVSHTLADEELEAEDSSWPDEDVEQAGEHSHLPPTDEPPP